MRQGRANKGQLVCIAHSQLMTEQQFDTLGRRGVAYTVKLYNSLINVLWGLCQTFTVSVTQEAGLRFQSRVRLQALYLYKWSKDKQGHGTINFLLFQFLFPPFPMHINSTHSSLRWDAFVPAEGSSPPSVHYSSKKMMKWERKGQRIRAKSLFLCMTVQREKPSLILSPRSHGSP